ncbi:hypothetical protein AVEN_213912-1 [Araneus ventricosus]|uniref:Uncharacterized protein n=1 Tax=Araneus ventricosus TaxID=182803 RepID=A0A4Y2A4R7_ARAVE|nr:hypothetical protein AVEN_213912-1 [Araneus ventricosus]
MTRTTAGLESILQTRFFDSPNSIPLFSKLVSVLDSSKLIPRFSKLRFSILQTRFSISTRFSKSSILYILQNFVSIQTSILDSPKLLGFPNFDSLFSKHDSSKLIARFPPSWKA